MPKKNNKTISKQTAVKTAARRSKRNSKRKELPSIDGQRSVARLRREREALEQEMRQLDHNIYAYESEYLSTANRGNAIRGYSALLAAQLPQIPDRIQVEDEERLFSKTQS